VPPGIHVAAFSRLRPLKKFVRIGNSRLELERRTKGSVVTWEVTLEVFDGQGGGGLGTLDIIIHQADRTLWVAIWKINNRAVAKIDVERVASRNLSSIENDAGKLNARKKAARAAFLPHWRFLDPATGDLETEHRSHSARFPPKMSIEKAVPKWCREELNIEIQPSEPRFFKREPGGKLEPVDVPDLFADQ
jgi:hypothetical protein